MKRTGKLFALLAAIVMALVLVPRLAWGVEDSGDIEDGTKNTGTITIQNPKPGETYTVYKIFDLASFSDTDNVTGMHDTDTEAYTYVIEVGSPWYTFLTTYGPTGADSTNKYAVTSQENSTNAYFIIDTEEISLTPAEGSAGRYLVVHPTENFRNAWDLPNSSSTRGEVAAGATAPIADGNIMSNTGGTNGDKNYGVVQSFAQEALKYAEATSAINTSTKYKVATLPESESYVKSLPLGYYLVGTTMGTLASLDTNNKSVLVYEKNDEPAIEKKVLKKGSDASLTTPEFLTALTTGNGAVWVDDTDADIYDYVMFRTVITGQQGAKNYVLHDVMEEGLSIVSTDPSNLTTKTSNDRYTGSVSSYLPKVYLVRGTEVYSVPSTISYDGTTRTNYTFATSNLKDEDCDFEITFNDADGSSYGSDLVRFAVTHIDNSVAQWIDIQDNDKIVITYWALVNSDARLWGDTAGNNGKTSIKYNSNSTFNNEDQIDKDNADERNTNSTVLTYGNNSRTAWDQADVTVYRFDIAKTKGDNADSAGSGVYPMLAGAQFSLYKKVERGVAVSDASAEYNNETLKAGYAKFTPNGATAGIATDVYYNTTKMKFTKNSNGYTYKYNGDSADSGETTLQSDGTNEINVQGLEAWDYILIEDKAPTGYNKLANPIVVTINGDTDTDAIGTSQVPEDNEGLITVALSPNNGSSSSSNTTNSSPWKATVTDAKYTKNSNGGVHIINQSGQELPSTGGLGTKAFYAIGGSLFAASVIFLLTKKRLMQAA